MTALELIKSRAGGVEALNLFLENKEAHRVLTAWPMMGARCTDRPLKKKETETQAIDELWEESRRNYSMQALADQADVPYTRCESVFYRLIRAGLIYPDGTISKPATDLLYGRAMGHIRGMMFGGKKRSTNA